MKLHVMAAALLMALLVSCSSNQIEEAEESGLLNVVTTVLRSHP